MKILTGIPTRNRSSAGPLAGAFANYSDVLVVSNGSNIPDSALYKKIEVGPGLAMARNEIFEYAIEHNYDVVVQCDDDIKFGPGVLEHYFEKLHELIPQGIASVSSKARIYEFWDGPCKSNKDYEVIPRLQQCWGIATHAVQDCGLFDIDTLEDVEYSLRLVAKGYIPAQIAVKRMIHGHSVQRNKTIAMGGQPVAERLELLDSCIASINNKYNFAVVSRKGEGSFSCKLDWKAIKSMLPNKDIGYTDKRGIKV